MLLDESRNAVALTNPTRWEYVLEEALDTPVILILDEVDVNRRLLRAMLKSSPYKILEARRPSEAIALLEENKVNLVVVDLILPEVSGPDFCRYLKADRRTQLIPIMMMTSVQGVENEIAGIASGADEFLLKPLQPAVVRTRIRALLRHKALIDELEEAESILFALAQSVEHRDKYTGL
ncbi:MAG: response regulator, partial [Bryobacteraceae bacterium]